MSLARNTLLTFGRQLGAGLLQLVTLAVIGRVYGAEGTGIYSVALLLPALLSSFLSFGLAPANVYFLGSKQFGRVQVWKTSLKVAGVSGALGLMIGIAIIISTGNFWFPGVPVTVLVLALATFPFVLLTGFASSMFQGLQEFRAFNLIMICQPLANLVGISSLTLFGYRGFEGLLASCLLSHCVTLVLTLVILRRHLNVPENEQSATSSYTAPALRYGYKAHLSNILAFVNYRLDIFLVNFLLGVAAAGIYVLAVQLVERLWMLSQAVSTTLLPRLSELSSDEDKRRALTPLVARSVLWATLVAALCLAAIAVPFIHLVFGPDFYASYWPLLLLLPGIVLGSGSRVLANDTAARGRPEINMYSSILVILVNLVGNLWLIPLYGIEGAAIATTFAYTLNFILRLAVHQWLTGIVWSKNIALTRDDYLLLRRLIERKSLSKKE